VTRVPHHFLDNQGKCEVAHISLDGRVLAEYRSQEGYMAPKAKPARLVFVGGMALAILALMTWAMAQPSQSVYPIYQPQLLLLY
jgi:hypothetical protein